MDERAGKYICPKAILSLPERDLQFHLLWLMSIFPKEIECVLEDGRATLHPVIKPGRAEFPLIQVYRGRLSAAN